jgi:phosphoenolpyruvate-protein kinase (PTS system EI component)
VTRDGTTIPVGANVGDPADADAAARFGADLSGLIRTEFLFLERESAPTVDEQEAAYRAVADRLGSRPVVFRTFDIGGDKPLGYLHLVPEANPFLGLRGIRLALARPSLLRDQLAAICRLAVDRPVSVMFPMVTHVAEVVAARALLSEAAALVGTAVPAGLQVGIMIEVPAAALKASAFIPHVDFVSIGTNDLTQYTLAADRGNENVAGAADPLDPAVLRLVHHVCAAAAGRVPVSVCGEVAADDAAVPILLGLGVDELSVPPYAVPLVKQAIRALQLGTCRALAQEALALPSATAVRALVAGRLDPAADSTNSSM